MACTLGRVLKDEDVLSTYKIQSSHTIHMVKGAARSGPSAQPAPPQQLPTMQAGQNPHDPLTQLNGPMGFGLMAGFNPFADMGLNPNDPNMVSLTSLMLHAGARVGCASRGNGVIGKRDASGALIVTFFVISHLRTEMLRVLSFLRGSLKLWITFRLLLR